MKSLAIPSGKLYVVRKFFHINVCVFFFFFFFCFRERVDWDANVDSLDREEVLLNIF